MMPPKVSGKYLVMLDADDWLNKDHIEICLRLLKKERESDKRMGFVYTDCNIVNKSGEIIANGQSCDFNENMLKTKSYIPRPALMVTQAIKDILPLDVTILAGSKHKMWQEVVKKGWQGKYFVEVTKIRIFSETTDLMETKPKNTVNETGFCVKSMGRNMTNTKIT